MKHNENLRYQTQTSDPLIDFLVKIIICPIKIKAYQLKKKHKANKPKG